MIIDSHQHFWRLETGFYDWIPPGDAVLKRNFQPLELAPQLRQSGVDGTVLVQAANTEDELAELCAHAVGSGFVRGIVGPLEVARAGAAGRIAEMAKLPLLAGLRPPFGAMFDADGVVTEIADAALDAMQEHRLALDCLAAGPPLAWVPPLAERHEGLSLVINHGGNPNLADGTVNANWLRDMTEIARQSNTVCKLSGLLTRLPAGADRSVVAEHVAILRDLFGPSRLLWGSDWPVLTKAASYGNWLELAQDLLADLGTAETAAVFGGNAMRIYTLGGSDDATA